MLMNKVFKTFFTLFIIFICQMFFCVQFAYEVVLEDDANLLTAEQEDKLKEEMLPLTEYGNIGFKSSNFANSSTAITARDYYYNHFGTSSGTVFYIDMYNREIYVFSDGENYKTITRGKAISITDNVYKDATKEEYYKCASRAFKQIIILLSAKSNKNIFEKYFTFLKFQEPMKLICNAFLAIIASSFIWYIFIFSKYKIKKEEEMIKNSRNFLNLKHIDAYVSDVEKIYSPRSGDSGGSSSGSSSRSSGGGSSSRSSGGGGGHRF